ncbi:MAG TPA: PRC-barrel domain-containing protein [Pirellulales bacterium]|nr:PRC-barrel domain-containing protein [Pirellulales bacterium]
MFGALLTALVGVSLVSAQQQPPPPPPPGAPGAQPPQGPPGAEQAQTVRAKQILGSKVNIQGDRAVGTVDDIVLDDHGNVDYLIVANSDGQLVTVPWDAVRFNLDKRLAVVHIAPDRFEQVPTYTAEQYPAFATPAYRTQVYQAYGLTPGQQRRMARRGFLVR